MAKVLPSIDYYWLEHRDDPEEWVTQSMIDEAEMRAEQLMAVSNYPKAGLSYTAMQLYYTYRDKARDLKIKKAKQDYALKESERQAEKLKAEVKGAVVRKIRTRMGQGQDYFVE